MLNTDLTGAREISTLLLRRLTPIFVVAVFSWVFFLPVSHNEILYPIFALLGLAAMFSIIKRDVQIDMHLWSIALLTAALALYGMALGNNNPDPIFSIAVFLAAPATYLLCAAATTTATLRYFVIAAVIGTLSVSFVLLIFIAGEAGLFKQVIPDWIVANLDLKATFRDGASQARSWGLSSLAGLGPIWMASLVVRQDGFLPHWGVRLLCALTALATAMISDRAGIVLVTLIAPFVAVFLRFTLFRTSNKPLLRVKRPVIWIVAGIAASAAIVAALPRLLTAGPITTLVSAISSFFGIARASGEADQSIRSDQAWHLLEAWALNPIFGAGFRSPIPGYAYASEIPWSLELQYHLLLFSVGLVGVSIALVAVVVGLIYLRKAVLARRTMTPILVSVTTGAVTMLIANATNPYLVAPGHQWAIFLPLAVACVAMSSDMPRATERLTASHSRPGRLVAGTRVADRTSRGTNEITPTDENQ